MATRASAAPTRAGSLRAAVGVALVALAVGAYLAATAAAAAAHADFVSSTPRDGASVQRLPRTVTLSFSEPVRTPAFVEVLGPDGEDVSAGPTQVRDADVTKRVGEATAAGEYAMSYRITSADGHPVSGTVRFTLAGEPGGGAGATTEPTSEPTTGPTDTAEASQAPAPTEDAGGSDGGGLGTGQLALLLAALAVGLAALAVGTRRALHHSTTMAGGAKGGRPQRR